MKVFFDTNVLFAALAARGLCADLMRVVIAEHELLTGEVNITELRRVLKKKLKATPAQIDDVERFVREHTIVPKPKKRHEIDLGDRDDEWVLTSAIAAGADLLVTGDKDLLDAAEQATIPILTPREAWDTLRHQSGN